MINELSKLTGLDVPPGHDDDVVAQVDPEGVGVAAVVQVPGRQRVQRRANVAQLTAGQIQLAVLTIFIDKYKYKQCYVML